MDKYCLYQGNILSLDQLPFAPFERLLYGDGFFETMRYEQGRIPLWTYHLQRIQSSCEALGFEVPAEFSSFNDVISNQLVNWLGKASSHRLRLVVVRRRGGLYKALYEDAAFYFEAEPLQHTWNSAEPIDVVQMLPWNTDNRLMSGKGPRKGDYVTPSRQRGTNEEVIFYNGRDCITEGSYTNVLYYRNGSWQTPSAAFSMVQGVFRAFLLDKNFVQEGVVSRFLLQNVEALALCNAIQGIIPVRSILGKEVNHSKEIIEEFIQQLNSTLP
jgi:branched-subunit amino acid aminotransferase/4-amino-4-deoxychorismate lyase